MKRRFLSFFMAILLVCNICQPMTINVYAETIPVEEETASISSEEIESAEKFCDYETSIEEDTLVEEETFVEETLLVEEECPDEDLQEFQVESLMEAEDTTIMEIAAVTNYDSFEEAGIARNVDAENKIITISTAEDVMALTTLSNCNPALYQNYTIKISVTGSEYNLISNEGDTLRFLGLGSSEYPFAGSIECNLPLKLDTTLFRAVSSNAQVSVVKLVWCGYGDVPVYAEEYVFEDENNYTLLTPIEIASGSNTDTGKTYSNGALLGTVKGKNGTLTVNNTIYYNTVSVTGVTHAGLICNSLQNGNLVIGDSFTLPSAYSVTATNGSAGGLVGAMGESTTLSLKKTLNATVTISGKANAGGLVGMTSTGCTVTSEAAVSLSADITVENGDAGGVIGKAENTTVTTTVGISFSSLSVSAKENGGGLYGSFFGNANINLLDNITMPSSVTVKSENYAGGLVGLLNMGSNIATVNSSLATVSLDAPNAGGIVGQLSGGALKVSSQTITETATNVTNHGGVASVVNNAFLSLDNVSVITNAAGTFGGVAAIVGAEDADDQARISVNGFTLGSTETKAKITSGAGIAAFMGDGTALQLSGTTDFTNTIYSNSASVAQLVADNRAALIYAKGSGADANWTYKRTATQVTLDDLGTHNEVVRFRGQSTSGLSNDLIAMNSDTGVISYKDGLTVDGSVDSLDEFALLAIGRQTKGKFGTAIFTDDLNITLNCDIDLAGTGITGLTTDYDDGTAYRGTVDGGGYTITLAIGEAYGMRGEAASGDGCGIIYRHGRVGLFNTISGSSVSNLTLDGYITVNARKGGNISTDLVNSMAIGSLSAVKSSNNSTLSGLKVATKISVSAEAETLTYIGGVIGYFTEVGSEVTIQNGSEFKATITLETMPTTFNHIGGFAGLIHSSGIKTINVNDLTIGGAITTNSGTDSYAGGFIGNYLATNNKHSINIQKLVFDSFTLKQTATNSAGGLLGYSWGNVDVTFSGTDASNYALSATDANLNCSVQNLGGLVYMAGGMWKVGDYAIDMSNVKIFGGSNSLGLLVNQGYGAYLKYKVTDKLNDNKITKNLYMNNIADWTTAYLVPSDEKITSNPTYFDEWVVYTTAPSNEISNSGKAIISLTTTSGSLTMDGEGCNSYVNRTDVGTNHKTNGYSRYYYNLDAALTRINATGTKNNGWVDSTDELLVWNAYQYAHSDVKEYLKFEDATKYSIGRESVSVTLDMTGYSYYPINMSDVNVTIKNATIILCADKIAAGETTAPNKTNLGSSGNTAHTQHYSMHCALFRDYTGTKTDNTQTTATLTVRNATMKGSTAVLDGGACSGALIMGKLQGISGRIAVLDVDGLTLDGLKIYNLDNNDVFPLLVNKATKYATVNIINLTGKDLPKSAASSLIGCVGKQNDSDAVMQLSLTFGRIKLPETKGQFTRASLLESFRYGTDSVCAAVYNFVMADDVNHANVTYGSEINGSKEYENKQLWYYDETGYGEDTNLVPMDSTTTYLPYVAQAYETEGDKHEIRVNHRSTEITVGCGSYNDPYVITDGQQLTVIAKYIANDANAPSRITIVDVVTNTGEYELCNPSDSLNKKHRTYEYTSTGWQEVRKNGESWETVSGGKTLSNATVWNYVRNAYYQISGTVAIDDFIGLGTYDYPFRGVLIGTNTDACIKLTGNSECLIPYSYGSVVKDLKVEYDLKKNLTYSTPYQVYSWSTNINVNPKAVFGGVIGCILGGDNFIDSVSVSISGLNLSGEKQYLIATGGYVGVISGGGVIFRNNSNVAMSGTTIGSGFYNNPFVGRVLNGFAFSEGCTLDNCTQNYQIAQLTYSNTDYCLEVTGTAKAGSELTITVNSAQGLLILSALTNSGAVSVALKEQSSLAYLALSQGKMDGYYFGSAYGKRRLANYDKIGEISGTDDLEWINAKRDDCYPCTVANPEYLVCKYVKPNGTSNDDAKKNNINTLASWICYNSSNRTIVLKQNSTLDMSYYSTGFRGISARYVSNAVNTTVQDKYIQYAKCDLELKFFNGNGATVILAEEVKEYADDDFHAGSVGGIVNVYRKVKDTAETKNGSVRDFTISGTVSLTYYSADGVTEVSEISNSTRTDGKDGKYCVSVGGFAGTNMAYGCEQDYLFENIKLKNLTVKGPNAAGGFMGSSGMTSSNTRNGFGMICGSGGGSGDACRWGFEFKDCSYDIISVIGGYSAGGFVGNNTYNKFIFDGAGNNSARKNAVTITKATSDGYVLANDSTITVTADSPKNYSASGAIFGTTVGYFFLTTNQANAKINEVTVSGGTYSGGLIGVIKIHATDDVNGININGLSLSQCTVSVKDGNVSPDRCVGGLIGRTEADSSYKKPIQIQNILVDDTNVNGGKYAGGIVGHLTLNNTTDNNPVYFTDIEIKDTNVQGGYIGAGGIIGRFATQNSTNAELKVVNTKVNSTKESPIIIGPETCNPYHNNYGNGGMIGIIALQAKISRFEDCKVQNVSIRYSGNSGGYIGSNYTNSDSDVELVNCSIENSIIDGQHVAGIIGYPKRNVTATNLLVFDISIVDTKSSTKYPNNQALVSAISSSDNVIHISGLSVHAKDADAAMLKLPVIGATKNSNTKNYNFNNYTGYIAFADYNGSCLTNAGTASVIGTTQKAPYVTTSPVSKVLSSSGAFFGDGFAWTTSTNEKGEITYVTNAEAIIKGTNATGYAYANTGKSIFDFSMDTFKNENLGKSGMDSLEDFPVLIINGGEDADTTTAIITAYLNVLTNGGYSNAKTASASSVTETTALYIWNGENFVENTTLTKSLNFTNGKYQTTSKFDNNNQRFSLITVSFTEAGESYQVQVPVVVRRMMELDFTATLDYGTNFQASSFESLSNHILDSYGNSMTAYITYRYNYAKGVYSEFDWQGYMESGGEMLKFQKKLVFTQDNPLPKGTQLTLVDAATRKTYTYVTGENENEISYDVFRSITGDTTYKQLMLSELLNIQTEKKDDGLFVTCDQDKATVQVGEVYYRLANAEDKGDRYCLTVQNKTAGSQIAENFFLVVTMATEDYASNGDLRTSIISDVPCHVNCILRSGGDDSHSSTASTYQISTGYEQVLAETKTGSTIKIGDVSTDKIVVAVQDTITFSNDQIYNTSDALYQRFVASLKTHVKMEDSSIQNSVEQFPSGTKGTVKFTILNSTGEYWNGSQFQKKEYDYSYQWVSNGGNMELPCAFADGNGSIVLLNLGKVRDAIKGEKKTGTSSFIVKAEMEVSLPQAGVDVIPESTVDENGTLESYASLYYVGQVSNDQTTLSQSATRAFVSSTYRYYREPQFGSSLTFDAELIDQLGINLLDKQTDWMDSTGRYSRIEAIGKYDLTNINNIDSLLRESDGATFYLSLYQRDTENGSTENYCSNAISDPITYARILSNMTGFAWEYVESAGSWKLEVPKENYCDASGKILTDGIFDGSCMNVNLEIQVDTIKVEELEHYYDNYKLVLSVELYQLDANSQRIILDKPLSDYIIYTLCKINTDFVDE